MDKKRKNAKIFKLLDERYMKDDPLKFMVNTLNFNIRDYIVHINVVKCMIALYLQTYNIIGIIYICEDETRTYLKQYISLILTQQVGIVSYFLQIYYTRTILHLTDQMKMFYLSLNTNDKILRQCAMVRKLIPLLFIIILASYFIFVPIVGDEEDIEFTVMFIKRKFGIWSNVFQGLYYMCFISLGYSSASACTVCVYILLHARFQLVLLTEYLKHISDDLKPHIEDTHYQEVIQERLRSFIRVHAKVKTFSSILLEIGNWSVMGTAISGSLLYAGLAYFLLANVSPASNFRLVFSVTATALASYLFIRNGQQLQDESIKLYNVAWQCQWIHWNIQNRRTLLMIMINSSKVEKMSSFGLLDLGHELLLKILQVAYSTMLLFIKVNDSVMHSDVHEVNYKNITQH